MKRWICVLVCLSLIAPFAAYGQAQPIPLDTVLVDVDSRASSALGADTRAVEVVTVEQIRSAPASNLPELLQWALGVELMPRSAALHDVAIRGSSFEQVLILVDGIRMRDGQTGHFNLNLAVPISQVERIEILRGPAASLYGSDAMAGVINIVTRKAGSATSVSVARGSFETVEAAVSARRPIGRAALDVATDLQRSDGHRDGTDYELVGGRVALVLPVGGESLNLEVGHSSRDFGAAGFYGNFPSFEATRTTTAAARLRIALDSTTSIDPVLHFRRSSDDFILFREEPARYRNRHTTEQVGGEAIGRVALGRRTRAAVGIHAFRDEIESSALGAHVEWATAASLELALGSPDGTTATAGVRADHRRGSDVVLSPGASFAWRPSRKLGLRSSAGRSFRAPTWTERYYEDPSNIGNPDLEPEYAWSAEGGFDLFALPRVRLAATAFLRDASDLIDWARPSGEPQTPYVTRNVESAEFRGLEAEIDVDAPAGFLLELQGQWLSMRTSVADGYDSKYALRPQVDAVSLATSRWVGPVQGTARATRSRRTGEEAHTRIDGRVVVEVRGVRVWGDLRNALDERYLDITLNPAPGRSTWIGVEWSVAR